MMAEQSDGIPSRIKVLRSGERVIVDTELTVSRSYMYFYLLLNIGAVVGEIGMVHLAILQTRGLTFSAMIYAEKFVGFWLSYTIPLAMFLLCPVVLAVSCKYYVRTPPSGSVLSQAIRLLKFATKGKWSFNPMKT